MAKRRPTPATAEQLDDAVEALMTHTDGGLPTLDAPLAELLRIAADLQDLPSPDFKARLRADLALRAAGVRGAGTPGVPTGYHSATPCLVVADPPRAIDFYKRAFDAVEVMCLADASGSVM